MTFNWKENFDLWSSKADEETKKELASLDQKQIKEYFSNDLIFGTAGIRAKQGLGTNRLNKYTVARYVRAYGLFLKEHFSDEVLSKQGVLIFHDNRKNSEAYSILASQVLSSMDICATLSYKNILQPTPLLSYMIDYKNFNGGLNITASHNPKEFNGIKFYTYKGSQIEPEHSKEIQGFFNQLDYFDDFEHQNMKNVLYLKDGFEDKYIEDIISPQIKKSKSKLKILFSPQHGTSLTIVKKISNLLNIDLELVKKQAIPDENFTYTKNPNPGTLEAFSEAIPVAINHGISIIISIDPDGDRLGMMIKEENNWTHINGNQIAILILDFLIKNTRSSKLKNSFIVKSIVTSDQGKRMAEQNNIKVYETLTGFKYLANLSLKIQEEARQLNIKEKKIPNSLLVYEESYGSIINNSVRDKDAFQAFVIIVRMLSQLHEDKTKVSEVLAEIKEQYGDTNSYQWTKEIDSLEKVDVYLKEIEQTISDKLIDVKHILLDHVENLDRPRNPNQIPTKGIKIWFKGGSWVAIRPSGTEPILKFYFDFYLLDKDTESQIQKVIDSYF